MTVYILLFIFLLLLVLTSNKNVFNKNIVLFITFVLWIFAGFKGLSVGTDSLEYYSCFINLHSSNTERMFSGFQQGWYYLNLFFYTYFNYWIFQFFCYAVIIYGFSSYIIRNSSYIFLSFFLFVGLYFYAASFNILRQYVSLSIIFYAIRFIYGKKINFIIMVFVASSIHFTSILCLSLICLDKIKINKKELVLALIIVTFMIGYFYYYVFKLDYLHVLFSFDEGLDVYADIIGSERDIMRGLAYNLLFIIGFFLTNKRDSFWIKAYFVFIIMYNLLGHLGQGNRLFLFLQLNMLIAIPEIYNSILISYKKKIYLFVVVFYSIFYYTYCLMTGINEVIPYKMFL